MTKEGSPMKKVGVTGAAGSVGNISRLFDDPKFRFDVLDCTRRRELREAFDGCDAIAHLAAKKIPRFGGALSTLEVNVAGVNAAAAVALSLDADLIVTSTSDVYGNAEPPFAEDDQIVLGPSTTKRWSYAVSKLYDEHFALALAEERDLRVTILRLFNAYGPKNHLSWWGGPVVTFIEALLDGKPIEIHGDGQQTRTFTYVDDTVDGFVRALRTPEARGEIINVGGTETVTILELARQIQEQLGIPMPLRANFLPYEALPGKYQDVRHRIPDTTKARELLGLEAQVSLAEGIARSIDWHREQREARETALGA
jgi:UDP-glucose 4-epimerase